MAAARGRTGLQADVQYQHDPIGWLRDVLGVPEHRIRWSLNKGYASHDWDGTSDPLATVAEALAAGKDVGVESGTGTGKTYLAAALSLWFLACFDDALVITTAPKQLWHPYRRKWATERQHLSITDVAAAGGWQDTATLLTCYQQPTNDALLAVMSEERKVRDTAIVVASS